MSEVMLWHLSAQAFRLHDGAGWQHIDGWNFDASGTGHTRLCIFVPAQILQDVPDAGTASGQL